MTDGAPEGGAADAARSTRRFAELVRLGRREEAEAEAARLVRLAPDRPEFLNNWANALESLGRLDAAEAAYRQAIAAAPDYAEAWYNLGHLLHGARRLEEALGAYDAAVGLRAGLAEAHNNRGAVLRELGRPAEAIDAFDRALAARPGYADAGFNQAMCRLMIGDYVRGWPQYEQRWATAQGARERRAWPGRPWGGEAPGGRTLLLFAEQGFGDTLQFCRFAAWLAARGARVVLHVQRGLGRLLRSLDGVLAVIEEGEAIPPVDLHFPLMSLPTLFGLTLEDLPGPTPYLAPDAELARVWADRLAGDAGLRVGITWAGAGRVSNPAAAATDRRRSPGLAPLSGLAAVQGVRFFSLQLGPASAEAALWPVGDGPQMADHTGAIADFADTAAMIANLDLVISCDTSVAHLAGAIGRPVWILSRFDGCWRWLEDRSDSPWYPTARLFRQPAPGDWRTVAESVARALRAEVRKRGGAS